MTNSKDYNRITIKNGSEEFSLYPNGHIHLYSNDFDKEGKRIHYDYDANRFPTLIERFENPKTKQDTDFLNKITKLIKIQGAKVKIC